MAALKMYEKQLFENLFTIHGSGYVLDFSNNTFAEFFSDYNVDIYSNKYADIGNSKGKRLRSFLVQESDIAVGKVLSGLIEYMEHSNIETDEKALVKCKKITERLLGKKIYGNNTSNEASFLERDFGAVPFDKLNLTGSLVTVIKQRIDEIKKCMSSKSYLSVVFLCGSTLEGLLLDLASKFPQNYNQAKSAPQKNGKVKGFHEWSLNDLINVSFECNQIKRDVKSYSHSLREFRNYIHPLQQSLQNFNPDEHTAKISWQVLNAAIADITKTR